MSESNDSGRTTAVITGASAGIGEDLAHVLAERGYDLLLVARRAEKLEAVADEVESAHGVTAHVFPCDLSDDASADLVQGEVSRLELEVGFLANNAGFGQYGPYLEQDAEHEMDMLHLNMVALTRLTRLLLPGMVERREGRILNVASTAAFFPGPLMTVYFATKAYVLSYSLGLAEELRDTGVTVTCLCPGPTETEFTDVASMDDSRLFDMSLVMKSRTVAEAGVEAAEKGEKIRTPGIMNKVNAVSARLTPRPLMAKIVKRFQAPKD